MGLITSQRMRFLLQRKTDIKQERTDIEQQRANDSKEQQKNETLNNNTASNAKAVETTAENQTIKTSGADIIAQQNKVIVDNLREMALIREVFNAPIDKTFGSPNTHPVDINK